MKVDDYSTSEIIAELDRAADVLQNDGNAEPAVTIMRLAGIRLRQYQMIDRQRVIQALASCKKVGG